MAFVSLYSSEAKAIGPGKPVGVESLKGVAVDVAPPFQVHALGIGGFDLAAQWMGWRNVPGRL